MSLFVKLEVTVAVAVFLCACASSMKIDFTRLTHSQPFIAQKRNLECTGNPCPRARPFLCKSTPKCIALKFVCDESFDCEDGFDEDTAVCNAASRPSVEQMFYFLEGEKGWILDKFFGGVEPEMVAQSLATASDINDLQMILGLSEENVANLRTAFKAITTGDERPLLAMGMPDRSWHEVQYMLEQLVNAGFKV